MYGNKSVKHKADLDDRLYKMYDRIENTESLLIDAAVSLSVSGLTLRNRRK